MPNETSPGIVVPATRYIYTSKTIVFESHSGGKELTSEDSCRPLLDRLIDLCGTAPEYILAADATRYIFLLNKLKLATIRIWGANGPTEIVVGDLPIKLLRTGVQEWIRSFDGADCGLMPHYALDTGRFIETMLFGRAYFEAESWRIEPFFGRKLAALRESGDFGLDDKSFKREFSLRIDLTVEAVVPEGTVVNRWDGHGSRIPLLNARDHFRLRVRRCHLSDSVDENSSLETLTEQSSQRFNIAAEFMLKGYIQTSTGDDAYFFEIPATWVTHELRYSWDSRSNHQEERVLVPNWTV